MPKVVYCSKCGTRIEVFRKAIKGYGRIIELIEPHECLETPIDLDLTPLEIPKKSAEGEFVRNLDNLRPPSVSTADLRDRRKEQDIKSSAPASILDQMRNLNPSTPANELTEGNPEGGD
jgi:hypothetical protein